MLNLDITKSNIAIDKLLETTTNPRHRFILMSYARHRFLEFSGRYDEVLADDMVVDNPVYNLHALGFNTSITGKDQVRSLYRFWAETNQCIFYGENEQVAIADNFVASTVTAHQQVWGQLYPLAVRCWEFFRKAFRMNSAEAARRKGVKAQPDAMYLYSNFEETIWPYDDRGRLCGKMFLSPMRRRPNHQARSG